MIKITKKFMAGCSRLLVSPSWISSGWWAVRRDWIVSPDLSGLEEVDGVEPTPEAIAKVAGVSALRLECRWMADEVFDNLLPQGSTDGLERFGRTLWALTDGFHPDKQLDGVMFRASESQEVVFVDRRVADTFAVCDLVRGSGVAMVAPDKRFIVSDRQWTCSVCGATHDRDVLAANNIKTFGLRKAGQSLLAVSGQS